MFGVSRGLRSCFQATGSQPFLFFLSRSFFSFIILSLLRYTQQTASCAFQVLSGPTGYIYVAMRLPALRPLTPRPSLPLVRVMVPSL